MTAVPADTAPRPVGRYEWEAILRRAVLHKDVKYIGFLLATYADPDGSRVRPGALELSAAAGQSEATVRRRVRELRTLGLLEQVARGGGRGGIGKAAEYRLTLPLDLLEQVDLRAPGGAAKRGRMTVVATVSPLTQVSAQSDESPLNLVSAQTRPSPVDNSQSPLTLVSAQSPTPEPNDRSNDAVTERLSAQNRRLSAHSADQLPATTPTTKDRPTAPDPTQPDTPCGQLPADIDLAAAEPRPAKCPHGLPNHHQPDGRPKCPICRRGLPAEVEPP